MDNRTYHPKGGMCANCVKRMSDCSHLDFGKMQPMAKANKAGEVVVKCTGFVKTGKEGG